MRKDRILTLVICMLMLLSVYSSGYGSEATNAKHGSENIEITDLRFVVPLEIDAKQTWATIVDIEGTTEPNATIEIFVDGESQGTRKADNFGSFSTSVWLEEGETSYITITATYISEHSGSVSTSATGMSQNQWYILTEWTSGYIYLNSPSEDINASPITTSSSIYICGDTESNATIQISIDGNIIRNWTADASGAFRIPVTINEGENLVTVKATNQTSNASATKTELITLNTIPPYLTATVPTTATNQSSITVSGQTEERANITVNKQLILITNTRFSTVVNLTEGTNYITIVATTMRTIKNATIILTVIKDTIPPVLIVEYPIDGQTTEKSSITVVGTTDPDATLTVNTDFVTINSDGTFNTMVSLAKGNNTITIIVKDQAGNINVKTLIIVRKEAEQSRWNIPSFEAVYLLAIVSICVGLLKGRKKKVEGEIE